MIPEKYYYKQLVITIHFLVAIKSLNNGENGDTTQYNYEQCLRCNLKPIIRDQVIIDV